MPDLLAAVADIAGRAADYALERQTQDFRRWHKSGGSPVCEIDLSVDKRLRAELLPLLPDAGWLSEERADDPARLACRRVWIVDPIDGTRDYLRGRSGWAVSVALVEDGLPVLGVLAAPGRGERWTAEAGRGAWRNGERLAVSDRSDLAGARVPADVLPKADRDLVAVPKPNGIALRMALVAGGEADLLVAGKLGHEWDIAAAALIAAEAGATVTDGAGVQFRFNKPDPSALGVLVAVPELHGAVLERFGVAAVA